MALPEHAILASRNSQGVQPTPPEVERPALSSYGNSIVAAPLARGHLSTLGQGNPSASVPLGQARMLPIVQHGKSIMEGGQVCCEGCSNVLGCRDAEAGAQLAPRENRCSQCRAVQAAADVQSTAGPQHHVQKFGPFPLPMDQLTTLGFGYLQPNERATGIAGAGQEMAAIWRRDVECEDLPADRCNEGTCPPSSPNPMIGGEQTCRPVDGACECVLSPPPPPQQPPTPSTGVGGSSPGGSCRVSVRPNDCTAATCACKGKSSEACGIRASDSFREPVPSTKLSDFPSHVESGKNGKNDVIWLSVDALITTVGPNENQQGMGGGISVRREYPPTRTALFGWWKSNHPKNRMANICIPVLEIGDKQWAVYDTSKFSVPVAPRPHALLQSKLPFTEVERWSVFVVVVSHSERWFCGGGVLRMPVWDVVRMGGCYYECLEKVKASFGANRSMHELWCRLGFEGVRELGYLYYKSVTGCDGPFKNVSVSACVSAVLAEEFWLSLCEKKPANASWETIVEAGNEPVPDLGTAMSAYAVGLFNEIISLGMAVASPLFTDHVKAILESANFPDNPDMRNLVNFIVLSARFGHAHAGLGIEKALRQSIAPVNPQCLTHDLKVIGDTLPRVQARVFKGFFPQISLAEDLLKSALPAGVKASWPDLLPKMFAMFLQSNIVLACENAGFRENAAELKTHWGLAG